jgi:hypothetical protein
VYPNPGKTLETVLFPTVHAAFPILRKKRCLTLQREELFCYDLFLYNPERLRGQSRGAGVNMGPFPCKGA